MEYLVLGSTTCARNATFVWWQDGSSMFGLRFGKENQAEQVLMELFILSNILAIDSLKCWSKLAYYPETKRRLLMETF